MSPRNSLSTRRRRVAMPVADRKSEFAGLTDEARHDLAVTQIRSAWVTATGAIISMGSTVIGACYDGDCDAALGEDSDSDLFGRIVTSLGSIEGGPSETTLRNARRVVATNETYRSHFWKVLPFGHKVLLLPLQDEAKVAEGAQRAIEQAWSQRRLRKWVTAARKGTKKEAVKRGKTLKSGRVHLASVAECGEPESLERIAKGYEALEEDDREVVLDELRAAAEAIVALRRRLVRRQS